ncbi:long-chain fatty acid--CoA ligase [Blastococcus sp. Marseille-P5729]|uniref:acyl-CoA synthetase n=1 Tax=Blastococcus sp. Marseille-P5729 TaxID=2086582 RepID=UPI000D0FB4A9|nr:long-chain fatty acid--CoA ligase [Blastococcus sp. Marseille-P5729]
MDNGIGRWTYKHAITNPNRIALQYGDREITYAELNERSNRLADALAERGVERGDRVCILSTNSAQFLEAMFAVAKLGAIFVPINFRLAGPEIAYVLGNARPKVLFYSGNMQPSVDAALKQDEVEQPKLIAIEADVLPDNAESFEEVVASGAPENNERDVEKSDVAMIMYTSGTTGFPKGAMLTHGNIEANNVNIMAMADGISKYDTTVTPAPLFHIGGLAVHTLPLLFLGGKTVVLPAFDPAGTLKAMADTKTTVQFLVPAMWAAMTQVPDFDSYDVSSMRYAISGGAPCPIPVIEFFQNKGWDFIEGFGMTETCAGALGLNREDVVDHAGSVGQPALLTEARVVDEIGEDVAVGTVGELVLRGPNIFIGYWEMEDATRDAIRDGWFHTGDMARVDEDGFHTLVDRKKDMIISGGENVYPIEVEQALHRQPSIADVAVIGVPDERWGETVKAVVVPAPGQQIDADEVIAFSRENLAHFKCPTSVEVIDELPRNATGKILKRTLREQFTGHGETVTR